MLAAAATLRSRAVPRAPAASPPSRVAHARPTAVGESAALPMRRNCWPPPTPPAPRFAPHRADRLGAKTPARRVEPPRLREPCLISAENGSISTRRGAPGGRFRMRRRWTTKAIRAAPAARQPGRRPRPDLLGLGRQKREQREVGEMLEHRAQRHAGAPRCARRRRPQVARFDEAEQRVHDRRRVAADRARRRSAGRPRADTRIVLALIVQIS